MKLVYDKAAKTTNVVPIRGIRPPWLVGMLRSRAAEWACCACMLVGPPGTFAVFGVWLEMPATADRLAAVIAEDKECLLDELSDHFDDSGTLRSPITNARLNRAMDACTRRHEARRAADEEARDRQEAASAQQKAFSAIGAPSGTTR